MGLLDWEQNELERTCSRPPEFGADVNITTGPSSAGPRRYRSSA